MGTRKFIYDSYACREFKGVHRAVNRYQKWAKRYRYAMKMDIQQYFPSIDHILLKEKVHRRIKDVKVLNLIDKIIETAPPVKLDWATERRTGIPMGVIKTAWLLILSLKGTDIPA